MGDPSVKGIHRDSLGMTGDFLLTGGPPWSPWAAPSCPDMSREMSRIGHDPSPGAS